MKIATNSNKTQLLAKHPFLDMLSSPVLPIPTGTKKALCSDFEGIYQGIDFESIIHDNKD